MHFKLLYTLRIITYVVMYMPHVQCQHQIFGDGRDVLAESVYQILMFHP